MIQSDQFSWVYMNHQEAVLAQRLKNSYIIYDGPCEWYSGEKLLSDLQQSYLEDDDLTFYKNRLEISPKIIKKIRQSL